MIRAKSDVWTYFGSEEELMCVRVGCGSERVREELNINVWTE